MEGATKINGLKQALQVDESNAALLESSLSDDFALDEGSIDSINQYQTKQAFENSLEESISLVERTAKKLIPIYKQLHKRLV